MTGERGLRRLLVKADFILPNQTMRDHPTRRDTTGVCLYEYVAL